MKQFALISLFILFYVSINARTITGRVSKLGGEMITGAKISAKDAPSIFTFSDSEGFYKIEIPEEIKALIFSHTDFLTKEVEIGKINSLNVVLVPNKYKKLGFGVGITYGKGSTLVYNESNVNVVDTSVLINHGSLSFDAHLFYRFGKRYELQGIIGDDFNFMKYTDSLGILQTGVLNRFTIAVLVNFHFNVAKNGNYSIYTGLGPQFQHFGFLNSNVIGIRLQAGMSLNNYGFNTKLFIAGDISNGVANLENLEGFNYKYSSFKIGIILTF